MASPSLTLEALLSQFPAPIAGLASTLCAHLRELVPEAKEVPYAGWRAIGYRHPEAGYIGGVFLYEDHISLFFEHGYLLPDPEGILQGDTKQTRHIPLSPGDAIPSEALAALVHAAVDVGIALRGRPRSRA